MPSCWGRFFKTLRNRPLFIFQLGIIRGLVGRPRVGLARYCSKVRLWQSGPEFPPSIILLDKAGQVVHIHIMMSKELDMSAPENCVCFNLRRAARAVTQFYDAEIRRQGIRPTQGSILAALMSKDSWNMAELSDGLGMERTTLVRNLRPLQRDGYVKVVGGGRGNRVELTITTKGRKLIEKLTPAWKSAQSAVVKTLGEKRWSAILSDLETAALSLSK